MRSFSRNLIFTMLSASIFALCSCTEPGETTGIGAATGGVIGAGLGAIVGSQTGSAGAGLVVGSVAGASAGGLVGNALESQDKAIRTQDEALERHQRIMQAQRNEIEELRKGNDGALTTERTVGGSPVALLTPDDERIKAAYAKAKFLRDGESTRVALSRKSENGYFPARSAKLKSNLSSARHEKSQKTTVSSADWAAPKQKSTKSIAIAKAKKFEGSVPVVKKVSPSPVEGTLESDLAPAPLDLKESATDLGGIAERDISSLDESTAVEVAGAGTTSLADSASPAKGAYDWSKGGDNESGAGGDFPKEVSLGEVSSGDCEGAATEIQSGETSQETADKLFHFRRALRLCPNKPEYHVKLGQVYLALNRPTDAVYEFKEALSLDPSQAAAKEGLASLGR